MSTKVKWPLAHPPVSRCHTLPSSLASSTGVWPTSRARRPCTGWVSPSFRRRRDHWHTWRTSGSSSSSSQERNTAQSANGLSACSRPTRPSALSTSMAIGNCSKRSTKRSCSRRGKSRNQPPPAARYMPRSSRPPRTRVIAKAS
ncbi:Hypothetical protein PPUBIRD1_2655 [Pseudomonas putida BIRD-1]|nr:Hypothetical protein PPUBIRD1_2655 [Pseudomonas putida BIRD-1]